MDNATIRDSRHQIVSETVSRIREIEQLQGVTRPALDDIMAELLALARREELFPSSEFLPPADGEKGAQRYLLQEDPDHRFALYLNALNPGNATKPHDHTTWAVVVSVDGAEHNTVYRRLADGLEVEREVVVEGDIGIALMPDDIHAISTPGDRPTRHLHMYGLALEMLDNRMGYDPDTGAAIPYNKNFMKPSVVVSL